MLIKYGIFALNKRFVVAAAAVETCFAFVFEKIYNSVIYQL